MHYYSNYSAGVSTPEDRAALFDEIVEKIMSRDAFVPVKLERLGLDVRQELLRYRDEVIAADSDEKLIYAILKLSCARKDPHVRLHLVAEGLQLTGVTVGSKSQRIDQLPTGHAPIRFAVDYTDANNPFVFVADFDKGIQDRLSGQGLELGNKLISVNGQLFEDYFACVEPYNRYATRNGLWWRLATKIPQQSREYPPHFYSDEVTYGLEAKDGTLYEISLPYYSDAKGIDWTGSWKQHGDHRYEGFDVALQTSTYVLYTHNQGAPVIILDWNKFDTDIMQNMDKLVSYASEHSLLDCAVIFDATRSGGGSLGAYAVQRLSPKPFKTTFGNLRISDVVEPFIEQTKARKAAGLPMTAEDGGDWLIDWLETDVRQAIREAADYSNDVPFKSSHLPKDSDGIMQPAELHFRGPMVCLLSPHGGSHLDQFVAMIADNNLAHIIGMPAGGYSNTWEWEETLRFPICKKPVVKLMYSMGHTIRPNGELLEGNPAQVDEYIPQTRENIIEYHNILLSKALEYLGL